MLTATPVDPGLPYALRAWFDAGWIRCGRTRGHAIRVRRPMTARWRAAAAMRAIETIEFDGRAQFHAAVLRAIDACRHSLLILDRSLQDWPFETAEGSRTLEAALVRGVRLRILLGETDWAERHGERLRRLRRAYSARVEIRRLPQALPVNESLLVGDRQHALARAHWEVLRGSCVLASPAEAEAPTGRFESLWTESEPCLPATTLGL